MNICKDCKHFQALDRCRCAKSTEYVATNLVTGEKEDAVSLCSAMRSNEQLCGLEGRLFEPLPNPNRMFFYTDKRSVFGSLTGSGSWRTFEGKVSKHEICGIITHCPPQIPNQSLFIKTRSSND